jgi:3-oxoacyl-[acyl-carrier protein] reductase
MNLRIYVNEGSAMTRNSELSRSIRGSVALITGAGSGMGRATAHLFADEGARVAIVDINEAGLERVAGEIREAGGDVFSIAVDCAQQSQVTHAVEKAAAHFGALDILVNNAGLVLPSMLDDPAYDTSWQQSLDIMVSAQQWAIRAALPFLKSAEHPRIVNIASTEALGATANNSPYVVAKHASLGLTRAMAVELGKLGITVNCVCPGPIHTGITEGIPEDDKAVFARRRTALRRYGVPEEVAHITLALVLPSASFITGAAIPVDGGLTIRNA